MTKQSLATTVAVSLSLMLIVALAGGLIYWLTPKDAPKPQAVVSDAKLESMKREAVAATEHGENFLEATGRWNEIIALRPGDRLAVLNQAVTLLAWVKHIDDRMSVVASNDRAMNSRLAREQTDAYKLADRLLVWLNELPPLELPRERAIAARQAWLESSLFEIRSREFQGTDAFKLRKLAVERLLSAINQDPKATWLVSRMVALLPAVKDSWPESITQVAEAAYKAWKAEPQSLYLQIQAARVLMNNKDARFIEPLAASIEQSPKLRADSNDGKTLLPTEVTDPLVESSRQAISAGNWSSLGDVTRWLDSVAASAAYAEDARRLQPELLSLLAR